MLRGYYTEVMHLGVNVKKKIRALEGELKTGLGGVKNITLPERRDNCKLIYIHVYKEIYIIYE